MITPTLAAGPPLELVELDDVDEVLELAELEELEELLELVELDDVDEVLELAELEELLELPGIEEPLEPVELDDVDEELELAELEELLELAELDELLELEGRGPEGRLEPPLSQPLASANRAMHAVPNFKSTIKNFSDFRVECHRLPATAKRPPGSRFACEAHQV